MSAGLLAVVTVLYTGVAAGYARDQRWGMCLAFVAYAVANVGFILDAVRRS